MLLRQSNSRLKKMSVETVRTLRKQFYLPLYTNAFYLMLNSMVVSLLGFVFWIVVTRFYTAADVGLAAALIAAVGLLASLSNLGFGIGIIRFLPEAEDNAIPMINSSFTIAGLASLAVALIFLAGLGFWSPNLIVIRQHPIFFASFVLFTVAVTLSALLGQVFIAKRRAKFTFVHNVIVSMVKLPLPIILAAFFGAFGIFASAWIGISVAVLVAMLWFLPRIEKGYIPLPTIHKQVLADIARYSLGNYFAHLLWIVPGMLLPLLVINILGAEMNAYFYIAWAIASVLFMIPSSICLSLFAEGSYERSLLRVNTLRSLRLSMFIVLPAVLFTLAIGDKVLLLFGHAYSQNATTLLWLLALSTFPFTVNNVFLAIKRVQKDIRSIILVSVAMAVIILGLSYFLMGTMGLQGVGVGWLAGQTVVAIVVGSMFSAELFRKRRI